MQGDDLIWSWCKGTGNRICSFCERHPAPPDDGRTVVPFKVPGLAQADRCPGFVLRSDAVAPSGSN